MTIQKRLDEISKEQYEDLYINSFSISNIIRKLGMNDTVYIRRKVVSKLEYFNLLTISNYSDDIIIEVTSDSTSYHEICDTIGLTKCSINVNAIRTRQEQLKCDVTHLYKNNSKIVNIPIVVEPTVPLPDGYKKCKKCDQTLPFSDFTKNKNMFGGVHYNCKPCSQQMDRLRYKNHVFQRNRIKQTSKLRRNVNNSIVRGIKMELGCMICGENSHYSVLEYHHPNDNKDITISQQRAKQLKLLISEIKKCVCLCANCHRKVHANLLNISHLSLISDHIIIKVLHDNNVDIDNINYNIQTSSNEVWMFNEEKDLHMKIPKSWVDEYISNGYVLGNRQKRTKQSI